MNENQVADRIISQIGKTAFFMMGTTCVVRDGDAIQFDAKSRKSNKVRVEYVAGMDLYRVKFYNIKRKGMCIDITAEIWPVFADQLHGVIEEYTGLRLSL